MVGITHKQTSLRKAIAEAILKTSSQSTIDAIQQKTVPKGDVFEFSRAAGLLAVKKTSDTIPDCHPLPIEFTSITHKIEGLNIIIHVEVHAIYRTGVEVEAMHGAAITALTMYDMLKPIDKQLEIASIRLIEKKGGKSDQINQAAAGLRTAVIVCSDGISKGERQDESGKAIIQKLEHFRIKTPYYEVISDDLEGIRNKVKALVAEHYDLLIFSGGTGLSPRDQTPEAISPLIERNIPGIMEAARSYGQERTAYAMLSRGVSGFIGQTLVITLPGSVRGSAETIDALFPQLLHVFSIARGEGRH
jgi:cyclic pyranopterin monophosphate synthase